MNVIITAAFVQSLLQRKKFCNFWLGSLSKYTDHSKHACTLMEGEIQKAMFCKRTCWSCVWKGWRGKKLSILHRIKYWSYIFYECFIKASYLRIILFLRKPLFCPIGRYMCIIPPLIFILLLPRFAWEQWSGTCRVLLGQLWKIPEGPDSCIPHQQ